MRRFRATRVGSELRASIDTELHASVTVSLLLIGSFLTCVAFYLRASVQSYTRRFGATRVGSELRASIDTELHASVTVSLLLIGSFLMRVAFYLRASSQSYHVIG